MQNSLYQITRYQSPTIVIFVAIAYSISNSFFLFAPFSSVPCFSCLFISVFCSALLFFLSSLLSYFHPFLLSLFITFLPTCFLSSYHVQYVKFSLSVSLLFSSIFLLFIHRSFLLTSILSYFLSSLLFFLIYYLFPVTFIIPNFFPPLFSSLLYLSLLLPLSFTSFLFSFHSISLLQLTLNIPTGVKHDYGATCLCQFLETQTYYRLMTCHIQYKIHEP